MRHDGLRASAKQREQFVNELALGGVARDRGLEDMKVSDLFHAANRLLALQAVNRGLNRGVSGAISFRKIFLNFADGGATAGPQRFHDLKLQLGEFRTGHPGSYRRLRYYYIGIKFQK